MVILSESSLSPRESHELALPEKVCTFQSLALLDRPEEGSLVCIGVVIGSVVSPKRYAQILTPRTHECDLIWQKCFRRCNEY